MVGEGPIDENKRATLRRFASIGAASPLATLATDDASASDSDRPDAIAGYLDRTPGAHFSKLRDDLQLGTGEAQHHLDRLVEEGVIETRKDGDFRRYFPADRFDEFEQIALGYLRRETPRAMIVHWLRDPEATGARLADRIGVSRATISQRAGDLEAAGLLDRRDGAALLRPETLLLLIVRYAGSFGPEALDLAADADDLVRIDRA
ncbi:winged helix-turn-helix transcriptional regulator [Halococcoides cellulosivorans]|uniref:MarR family transcriptional regulator n=1 Tax=Halococcoides cellulosivorans TaxID=1679096 RepID=A0A2R4WZX9_9EURY|nr:MarR family transcriptional regulator [Halococcoides cellulosivorans]AWB27075.1 MarR family transcriptional regulator [Halococcoides cellulosivorans]